MLSVNQPNVSVFPHLQSAEVNSWNQLQVVQSPTCQNCGEIANDSTVKPHWCHPRPHSNYCTIMSSLSWADFYFESIPNTLLFIYNWRERVLNLYFLQVYQWEMNASDLDWNSKFGRWFHVENFYTDPHLELYR